MNTIQIDWLNLKTFVTNKNLSIQYVELDDRYFLIAFDGQFSLSTVLNKDGGTNVLDFETNFKTNGNKKLETKDSDGTLLNRTKITTTGWTYIMFGLEFETSKIGSIYCKNIDSSDVTFATAKFLKDNGSGILIECVDQTDADANCIATQIDWEPTFDYEIIGGLLKQEQLPTQDVRCWVIGVPDIPAVSGGSKIFASNINLYHMGTNGLKVDGRAPKYLTYSSVYHSNKIRLHFKHPAGFNHKLHMIFEIFKP